MNSNLKFIFWTFILATLCGLNACGPAGYRPDLLIPKVAITNLNVLPPVVAYSSNGTQLLLGINTSYVEGYSPKGSFYLLDANGQAEKKLFEDFELAEISQLAWLPNKHEFNFVVQDQYTNTSLQSVLFQASPDQNEPVAIFKDRYKMILGYAWSPDGQRLAIISQSKLSSPGEDVKQTPTLYLEFFKTGTLEAEKQLEFMGEFNQMDWISNKELALSLKSSDKAFQSTESTTSPNFEIYRLHSDTLETGNLTQNAANETDFVVVPERQELVFFSDRTPNPDLYTLNLTDQKIKKLYTAINPTHFSWPCLSGQGRLKINNLQGQGLLVFNYHKERPQNASLCGVAFLFESYYQQSYNPPFTLIGTDISPTSMAIVPGKTQLILLRLLTTGQYLETVTSRGSFDTQITQKFIGPNQLLISKLDLANTHEFPIRTIDFPYGQARFSPILF